MTMDPKAHDAGRLETLWGTEFGDQYVDRNRDVGAKRGAFWRRILGAATPETVLEVGCNIGENLRWVAPQRPRGAVTGIDINLKALGELRRRLPNVAGVRASARHLPFGGGTFDLTYTVGVLIHQSPESLPDVMRELVRCSRRFVLCAEYFAEQPTEIPYRGQTGALFKRDFGGLYQQTCPELVLRERGWVGVDDGFDDCTWWLFEKA